MTRSTRFVFASLFLVFALPALARTVTDSAGRTVEIPDTVNRVVVAGPPAEVLLYVLAPEKLAGWVRAPREEAKPFLLPVVRDLPELGRLTGRGNTMKLEKLVATKPDLVIDVGTISPTYKSLADRVQAQTGIPYLLIDGKLDDTASTLRLVADILGVKPRGEELARKAQTILDGASVINRNVPEGRRERVYLARGAHGLETAVRGSINAEVIERAGATNVVEAHEGGHNLANTSLEQVIAWAPDTIITLDRQFYHSVAIDPAWQSAPAVANKRVFLAPNLPYGFIDSPPAVNRLIGLIWLDHLLYPEQAKDNWRSQVREFYRDFYQVELSTDDLSRLLEGAGN